MHQRRWLAIASSIKAAVRRGELRAGDRIATETEMALQWSVSPMTVHRALTELQREGWVVRKRRVGTVVADRQALPLTKIALIFNVHADLPQGGYVAGIEDALPETMRLVPMRTGGSAAEEARCIERAAAECSAVICYPTGAPENTPRLRRIAGAMPLLFVDCMPDGVEADVVMTDNFESIQTGLDHLRRLGHSRIAYFMETPHLVSSVQERFGGYRAFMAREVGAPDPDRWVRRFSFAMPWRGYNERVEAALIELLHADEPITAVACQQDATMAAVLEACVSLGLNVPEDLAVLSFCDIPPRMQPLAIHVHRLVQRTLEIGHIAAKRIELRLSNPGIPLQATRLMTDLYPAAPHPLSPAARAFRARRGGERPG